MKKLVVLLLALLSCSNHPSQMDAAAYGVVHVWYGPDSDWSSQQRDQFDLQLTAQGVIGPAFVRVLSESDADVSVRHWDSLSNTCQFGVARYTFSTHVIEIDPICTQGFLELRSALGHELGHHLGLSHVCRSADQMATGCSPVGTGVAQMNPRIRYSDPDITFDTYEGEIPPVDPTALDLAEFRRVHP